MSVPPEGRLGRSGQSRVLTLGVAGHAGQVVVDVGLGADPDKHRATVDIQSAQPDGEVDVLEDPIRRHRIRLQDAPDDEFHRDGAAGRREGDHAGLEGCHAETELQHERQQERHGAGADAKQVGAENRETECPV